MLKDVEKPRLHGPSFLRWAGSKRQSISKLRNGVSRQLNYIEPFAGSAALFFALRPRNAVLGDLNGRLINAFRHVRKAPHEVYEALARIPRTAATYYEVRAEFNERGDLDLRAAVQFVYLNRNCFNGLWRTNLKGEFNVPYGGREMAETPPLELFLTCANALKRAKLKHADFRTTISSAATGDFVFVDPPYFSSTERTFVEYGEKSFGGSDLEDLVSALVQAERRGAAVVLTYTGGADIPGIPRHWSRDKIEVTRNVGGFAGSRKKHVEVLYRSTVGPAN